MNREIAFAEWLAENHYILHNIEKNGVRLWKNEYGKKTTKQLFKEFINEITKNN